VARGRMLSSVRPLMRQEVSRRPVWEFANRVHITRSVLEAQWKALVVPAPSRRLLRHTLLPLARRGVSNPEPCAPGLSKKLELMSRGVDTEKSCGSATLPADPVPFI